MKAASEGWTEEQGGLETHRVDMTERIQTTLQVTKPASSAPEPTPAPESQGCLIKAPAPA